MFGNLRLVYKVGATVYCLLAAVLFLVFSIASTHDLATLYQVCMGVMLVMAGWSAFMPTGGTADVHATTMAAEIGFTPSLHWYFQAMIAISGCGILGSIVLNRLATGHLGFWANILFIGSVALCGISVVFLRKLQAQAKLPASRPAM